MKKEKSELLLNPYKEHLKKPYLHGAGTLEINGVQYSADEYITMLEEENKKLNIKVASLEGEIKGLNYTIDKLKEENQTLELWLDNKEKLNKGYREDVDYWHHRCMAAERGGEDED